MNFFSFSILQTILIAGLTMTLAACEVGPDYEKPETSLPTDWVSDEVQGPSDKAGIDQQWWKNFNDPVLAQLIDKASANNFDLKIAEARIEQARAGVSSADAALLPTGDVKGAATREANQLPFPGGNSSPFASLIHKPFNIFQTGFDASWELDLFGGNRRAEESAEAQMQASEASRDDVRVSLLAEVARDYVSIRQYQAQLAIAKNVVSADTKTLDIAKQLFAVGQSPQLDVTQAEATLEQAQTQLPHIRNLLAQTEYSLDVLLGEQPGAAHKIVSKDAPIPASDKKLALAAPAAVIAQRPDIRVAERKLAAATARHGVAVAKFFPDLSLTGFFGAMNTSVNNLATPGNNSWLAGGSVIWPILSYGALSANLDAANAQQQEALTAYQKTIIGALSDVERSLTAYTEQEKFLQSSVNEVEKDKHARAIAQERYQQGLTSQVEVLEADRALYAAEDRLTQARAEASQNLIAVYKSLGGGWVKG
ncbi:MAG: efflux transporter outer membrane subunit [Alphaproteobacteria bacterium]